MGFWWLGVEGGGEPGLAPAGALFCSLISSVLLPRAAGRGLPGGNSLFFCFAKRKVSKRKGDPGVCVPPLRYGQPAVLGPAGVWLNSLRSDNASPYPSGPVLLGAYTRGGRKMPIPKTTRTRRGVSLFVFGVLYLVSRTSPSWLGRGAQRQADQGWRCLSGVKRSEFSETPPEPSTAGCP